MRRTAPGVLLQSQDVSGLCHLRLDPRNGAEAEAFRRHSLGHIRVRSELLSWLLAVFIWISISLRVGAQDPCCLILNPAATNVTVIQTGGFMTLQSRTRPVAFPAVPGTFSISFSFGFATEELPIDGEILDSMILYMQNTNSGLTAVLFMADAGSYDWLPFSSNLFPLFDAALDLSIADAPNLPVIALNSVAFRATFKVPPRLATNWTDVTLMLYDYPNGLNSAAWMSPVTVIAPPGELQVVRTEVFRSFGQYHGAFFPTNTVHVLSNAGGSQLNWRASASANWASVTPVTGTLDWGRTTNVTVTVNSRARLLPPGFYTNEVSFFNDSVPTNISVRPLELVVIAVPELEVLPRSAGGEFRLRLNAMPFARYRIEAATDLTAWTGIYTNTTAADGAYDYGETLLPSRRFFRASFVYP